MPKRSAGLLLYRRKASHIEVLLVHPGGPYWARKDFGSWSIPKGEYSEPDEPLDVAKREFQEETGFAPGNEFISLGEVRQIGGKPVVAWAFEGDCNPNQFVSNTFLLEWPPGSQKQIEVPEVDRARWFSIEDAKLRLLKSQLPLLDRLLEKLQ